MGNNIFRTLMFALLLFTAMHVASANSFYANALEVSPGEVEELSFMLDNEQEFIGFQFDMVLPEGLEAVLDGDAVRCSLSGRADDTYSLFSNVLADGTVRIGAFSVQNIPFSGNSGSLLNVALRSSDSFTGGTLQIRNIRFVDVNNNDVILPNTSCTVTPRSIFVEALVMSQTDLSLREGQTAQLSVNVLPDNAGNKSVTWSSSDDAVATVGTDGLVTAMSLGEAVITATAADGSGVTATCRVTVGATPAEGVSVTAEGETTLKAGGTVQLRATVTPETATDKSVSWSTGNADVATVDGNGLVTAVGVGTATITCTNSAGQTATIDVTVERTPVSSITLNRETAALQVSGTIQLSATVLPETATDKSVTWSSSNDAVSTVSADGLVTAMSLGEALITATAVDGSGVTATCRVTVGATPAEGISITADGETTLKAGGTVQLRATVTPETATDKSVSWSTGNANVATVDGNGLVTAVDVGTATITCTNSAGQAATIDITVERTPVSSITLNRETAALQVSGTIQLSATVLPKTATDKSVTWSSSNDAISTVSADGLVTAMSLGEALITATAVDGSGVTATCRVTVGATPAEGISITADGETTLKAGGTVQLRATVTPETATDKSVSWSTGNANVATVDGNGLVTAVDVGTATITCTNSAGQTATIDITVEPTLITSISLDKNEATLNVGESLVLAVTVSPEDATDKLVTWATSDDDVAIVEADGVITAVGTGVAEVTATANDGSGVSATCVVTVKEQVTISWKQNIEAVIGDVVTLEAKASNGAPVAFRTVRSNGGYVEPDVTSTGGAWTATFTASGAVILEAYIESADGTSVCEPVRKMFNVLPDRDILLIDGIYYRYTDGTHSALSVTYGYRQYEGDVVVPPVAGGLPVVSVGNRAFYSNALLTSVTLPEGLGRIESDQAFGNCPQLTNVVLPSTLTYIGSWAFNSDSGFSEIHCRMKNPLDVDMFVSTSGQDIFNGFVDYDNCILYVPSGMVEAYREADVWRNFKNIVEEQPEPVLVAMLSLVDDELELNVGEIATLRAVAYPSNATNQAVEWTSSDETVATVDAYGEVLAVGQGTAVITATTVDGSGLSASCTVAVDLSSGISEVGLDGVRIVTDNGRIVVIGLSVDDVIAVHTISGALVYRGAYRPVTVQAPSVYLISIKGHTYKVAIR